LAFHLNFPHDFTRKMPYPVVRPAHWPLKLAPDAHPAAVLRIRADAERLANASQYGWGHTIDFGPFRKEGILGETYLSIAGVLDDFGWWPTRLDGMRVADVGCFTGGLSLLMAHRGATQVYAIDEIPEHLAQCSFLAKAFGMEAIRPILRPIYRLREDIEPGSLDLILLAGVLYHLSDMLVGLHALRELLKPDGLLLIQSNGIDDFQHSYANFGRFFAGMWWQPTGLCVRDMCEFMGYRDCEVQFYAPQRCVGRATRAKGEIEFRRGLNWTFDVLRDRTNRSLDPSIMAPAPLRSD